MFTPVEGFIAWRYTRARRRNQLISFIAATSIAGVTLGIAALLTILAIMNGFEREMRERLLGMAAHLDVTAEAGARPDWRSVATLLGAQEGVLASAPYIQGQAMVTSLGQVQGAVIHGIDPALEAQVSVLAQRMQRGALSSLTPGQFNLVLGRGLANVLRLEVGDEVTLILAEPLRTASGMLPRLKRFHLSGIFEAGVQEYDSSAAFVNLEDAARVFRGHGVQGLHVHLSDAFAAEALRERLAGRAEFKALRITDWTQTHANLFRALATEKILMFIILLLSVGVAAFNLVSTLVMVVAEKHAEIAVLQTLGMTPRRILVVFFTQGALIGLTGVTLGAVIGITVAQHIEVWIAWLEATLHFKILAPEVYYISRIPAELKPRDVVIALISALVMCLVAPLYPAHLASKTRPADALRYE